MTLLILVHTSINQGLIIIEIPEASGARKLFTACLATRVACSRIQYEHIVYLNIVIIHNLELYVLLVERFQLLLYFS